MIADSALGVELAVDADCWESAGESESESSEDTEKASENDGFQHEKYTEIKEQMYQYKLAHLRRQLSQLEEGTLPEVVKKLRRLDALYKERLHVNEVIRELEMEMVEQDYLNECKAAAREFEKHRMLLKEQLISELEEKQRMIETERHNMELTGDSMDLKPISTRKLRRRANEPTTGAGGGGGLVGNGQNNDKRRKAMQTNLQLTLDESEILEDLRIVNKNKAFSKQSSNANSVVSSAGLGGGGSGGRDGGNGSGSSGSSSNYHRDIRVEDGKLFYEKRWFHRGQAVQVEINNGEKFPAMVTAIGSEAVWVRKSSDNFKVRIYLSQLTKGKYILKRRAV